MPKYLIVKYKCTECGAEDSDKVRPDETPIPAINCWNCKAGRNHPNPIAQVHAQEGMLLVRDEKRAA